MVMQIVYVLIRLSSPALGSTKDEPPSLHTLATNSKLHLYRVFILPIKLYGSECWAIIKVDLQWINALDQRSLWRILVIHWHDFVRNIDDLTFIIRPISHHSLPLSSLVIFLWASCDKGGECRRQPSHFWAASRELEMSTWAATYYLDEDNPRRSLPWIWSWMKPETCLRTDLSGA